MVINTGNIGYSDLDKGSLLRRSKLPSLSFAYPQSVDCQSVCYQSLLSSWLSPLLFGSRRLSCDVSDGFGNDRKFWSLFDVSMMARALDLASYGASCGEVPVGAVLVYEGKVIGEGFNQPIGKNDPTCHAEIVALRQACQMLGNYRLPKGCTLYVTLEPCTMCVGALIHARLGRLVFATAEPRAGMVGSQKNLLLESCYNHQISVQSGLLAWQSSLLLKSFFRQRRK